MLKYIIHLRVPYYDYTKNESQKTINIEQDKLNNQALKEFSADLAKIDGIKLSNEEYTGQTIRKAAIVEIDEKNLDNILNQLRTLETVDIIEPETYEGTK